MTIPYDTASITVAHGLPYQLYNPHNTITATVCTCVLVCSHRHSWAN